MTKQQMIHVKVNGVIFDHDNELSAKEIGELTRKVTDKVYTFHPDEYCDFSSVADAISDDTGWCVAELDYTAFASELK